MNAPVPDIEAPRPLPLASPLVEQFAALPDPPALELQQRDRRVPWAYIWKPKANNPEGGRWDKPPIDERTGDG
jgi:hypothetical protein